MTYLIFSGKKYYPCGGLHDLIGCCDNVFEMIDIIRQTLRDEIPFIGFHDWAHVGRIGYGGDKNKIEYLGNVNREQLHDMLSPHGWLKEHIESITCSDCKAPPGSCVCLEGLFYYNGDSVGYSMEVANDE